MIIIFMMMMMMMMLVMMMMICDNDDIHIFHEEDFQNMLAHLTVTAKRGPSSKASPYCCSKAANFSCGRLDTYLPGN